jgi:hypothetical protein
MPPSLLLQALPKNELSTRFEAISFAEYGRDKLPTITSLKGTALCAMGLSVWDNIIADGKDAVEPKALAKYVDNEDPSLIRRIRNQLGKDVLFDVYYGHATLALEGKDYTVAETLIAHVYPNHLHIADIEFSNPYKPIPKDKRQHPHMHFEGLGLLGTYLANVERISRELKCTGITLTAATEDLAKLFSRYGFEIADTPAGDIAKQGIEISIPMMRRI